MKRLVLCAFLLWAGAASAQGFIDKPDLLDQIKPGVTTGEEVEKLLGKPGRHMHFPRQGIDALEYTMRDSTGRLIVSIAITTDGKVRDITRMRPSIP